MNIFNKSKIFIIGEIANSHEGNLQEIKKLIEETSKLKISAIKFQIFKTDELLESSHEKYPLFKILEFSNAQWKDIISFTKRKKLKVFADVFGVKSYNLANRLGVDGFKIHSSEINNPLLLKKISSSNKPILLSTAGSYLYEIDEVLKILQQKPKSIVLMHGFQGYPTQISELNLDRITELKKRYSLDVGLMDHISGNSELALIIPLLGISLGATVIEKHITLNRSKKRIDYYSSLNPNEFKKLIQLILQSKKSLGSNQSDIVHNELKYRLLHKKNTIAKKTIKQGTKLNENLFEFKRTKSKIESLPFFDINGKKLSHNLEKSKILTSKNVNFNKIAAVIACRVESDRLFGKPLQNISGIPILQLLINQIKTSKLIDDIVLAISEKKGNEIFIDFARKHEIKFVIGNDRDVLKRLIDGANYVNADIIFRVTSENPYLYWEGIDKAIVKHVNGNYDFTYIKEIPIGSGFEIINLEAFKKSHKLGQKKHRSELCSLYINEHKKLFKIQSIKPPKELQKPQIRLTVDTPEDLIVARIIHNSLGKKDIPIPLFKILKFLDKNQKITKINSGIPLGVTRIWP